VPGKVLRRDHAGRVGWNSYHWNHTLRAPQRAGM